MNTPSEKVHYGIKNYGFAIYNIGILIWAIVAFLVGSEYEVSQEIATGGASDFDAKYGTGLGMVTIGIMWVVGNALLLITYFATKSNKLAHS